MVRTVKVGFRRKDKREKTAVYWKRPLGEKVVAIQRLSLLHAVGEPLPTGTDQDQLPADASVRVALVRAKLGESLADDSL